MWQSPEDPNNPWQPFRSGQSFNISKESFNAHPHNCRTNEYHCDENWNSVKVIKNEAFRHETNTKEEAERYSRSQVRQKEQDCRLKYKTDTFHSNQHKHGGQRAKKSGDLVEYILGNQNASAPNDYTPAAPKSSTAETFQGNQWSPFLHGYTNVSLCQGYNGIPGESEHGRMAEGLEGREISWSPSQVHLDYRQPMTDDTYHSERSSYSTDTDEGDVADGYELVEHQPDCYRDHNDNVVYRKDNQKLGDQYNTPPTTLSVNDTYHTAPNSPRSDYDFYLVQYPEDFDQAGDIVSAADFVADESTSAPNDAFTGNEYKDQLDEMPSADVTDCVHGQVRQDMPNNEEAACSLETFTENITACLEEAVNESHLTDQEKQDIDNFRRFTERYGKQRIPKMELPPFIEVESVQYEADPKTGAVRTVGKGSFGQVFKARFADPSLQHLRIVVKEFNEEYTNRQEILDEAKRLLYLGDTGYVPICYGLVCLGDVHNPTYGLVQEYVGSGLTLEQVLWDQYALEIHMWLSIAFQACEGLARFHEKGILLNDIKSNNIILDFIRSIVRIKYIDFGLATDMRGKRYKNTKSLEDYIYLAPEVRKDGYRTNIASDIFSLGYMLDQICSIAGVHELGFMTGLCMDLDPDSRLPVRAAANIIYEHMVTFNYDTSSLSR